MKDLSILNNEIQAYLTKHGLECLTMNTFSERFAAGLSHADVTASQVAKHLKISPSSVSQWRTSDTNLPNAVNLIKTALFLGVDPLWLASGEGEMIGDGAKSTNATGNFSELLDVLDQLHTEDIKSVTSVAAGMLAASQRNN